MHVFKLLTLAAIAVPAFAFALDAPVEKCSDIKWSKPFLADFPKAPVACREVTVKDGIKYAKFNGKVSKVDDTMVQVEVSNVADTPITTIAFQIGVGGRITVGDKVEKVKDLLVGDVLTFWVRENQFGLSPTLVDRPVKIIKPQAMSNN